MFRRERLCFLVRDESFTTVGGNTKYFPATRIISRSLTFENKTFTLFVRHFSFLFVEKQPR